MGRFLPTLLGFGLVAGLAACAAPPPPSPPPPPTTVVLTLTATQDVNASPTGQGEPVVLRIYQLASPAGFGAAEFFDLFNQDQATLKSDLIKRDEVELAPGQTRTFTLPPSDQVKAIGVFAAYRDYAAATWRAMAEVPPHQTTRITVTAGPRGLTLSKASEKPPAPAES